jgi:hypothetical protein
MVKMIKTTDNQIISRIYGHGRGWVFTPDHFKDLGSRDAIASALKRHKHAGLIRQLATTGSLPNAVVALMQIPKPN